MSSNAYYRITPEGNFLKKEDYRFGFGMNTSLYNQIHNERLSRGLQTRDDFKEDWDTHTGENIEGKPFNTRHHPYQDLKLVEAKTGKIYVVDSVHKHHYFGFYIVLLIRAEGSQSHGVAYWENISCKDSSVIEGIEETKERFNIKKTIHGTD